MMISNNLRRRLAKLEEEFTPPAGKPLVIDVVFVGAATHEEREGFQVTIPMDGHPRNRRRLAQCPRRER